jgi:phosphate transport system permease protein
MKTITKKHKIKGEPLVWFSAMGLSVGLLMILGLLGLVLVEGLKVFWPKQVVEITLQDPSGSPETLLGEIVLKRKLRKPATATESGQTSEEWQLFLGNKDSFGQAFRFVEKSQIQKETFPAEVLSLERKEYGDAIGFPLALHFSDGKTIPQSDPAFLTFLKDSVRDAKRRWKTIRQAEKIEIGRLNRKMEGIEVRKRSLEANKLVSLQAGDEIKKLDIQKQALQHRYQAITEEVRALREEQTKIHLSLRLANREIREIEVGQILHYYFPNRLSLTDRLGLFFVNVGNFLSEEPREANTEGGVFPALFGTFVMTILMSLAVVPFGVLAAVYLSEYAKPGLLVRLVRIAVNNLAGVPSIVFGVFGLGFFVYMVGGTLDSLFFKDKLPTPTFGTGGLLWASLTLALMTVPVVIVSTEEALSAVSRGIREGALACGASKWQAIRDIILPASAPGILTGTILAMARGAGEVAPLMLVGVVKLAPTLPLNGTFPFIHLDQKFMHLGFHIFDLGFQSPDSEAAKPMVFATTLLLIVLVLVLNLGAIVLRERLRKKYAAGTF